jgi:hypothetical protein
MLLYQVPPQISLVLAEHDMLQLLLADGVPVRELPAKH